MLLHNDTELFIKAINLAAQRSGYSGAVVEKDYYVTLLLHSISQKYNNAIFKGGTALSKCYKLINRFSEDIDIAVDKHLTQGARRKYKDTILESFEVLGLQPENNDKIHSRRDFNRYTATYQSVAGLTLSPLKSALYIETYFAIIAYPAQFMPVTSIIGEMLREEAPELLDKYNLHPFEMKVQSLERTFIDKLFAICDYYLDGNCTGHSRHIYDLCKLLTRVNPNTLQPLLTEVREIRKNNAKALSAQDNINLYALLHKIVTEKAYKSDYETVTLRLLQDDVSYTQAAAALETILQSSLLK